MRTVVQRVASAQVLVDGEPVGQIAAGLLAPIGVTPTDTATPALLVAGDIAGLRILADERSVRDLGADVLVVSQFTLYADTSKGRRPSWRHAAPGKVAEPLVTEVIADPSVSLNHGGHRTVRRRHAHRSGGRRPGHHHPGSMTTGARRRHRGSWPGGRRGAIGNISAGPAFNQASPFAEPQRRRRHA